MRHPRRMEGRPERPSDTGIPEVPTTLRQDREAAGADVTVEIGETDREVVVKVALGWVVHDSIVLRCTEHTLHIEAERCVRPSDTRTRPPGWRQGDLLQRSIPLPCDVCPDRAHARYRQGVLTVTLTRGPGSAAGQQRPS